MVKFTLPLGEFPVHALSEEKTSAKNDKFLCQWQIFLPTICFTDDYFYQRLIFTDEYSYQHFFYKQ